MFRLNKWYMDCVAADGTAVVVYWARLSWGLLRLFYGAALVRRDGIVSETATLRPGKEPLTKPGGLAWRSSRLHAEGCWQALDQPLSRTLLASAAGNVEWHCLMPRARARVRLADGVLVEGLGYVERVDMTLRPWQLPIRQLRWGRFHSEAAAAVWIEWRGPQPLTLLNYNGTDMREAALGDDGLAWPGGRLHLEPGSVLRDGHLGTTVLARVPLVALLTPRILRQTHERKALRRGTLVTSSGQGDRVETGWVIDEVVRFGGNGG